MRCRVVSVLGAAAVAMALSQLVPPVAGADSSSWSNPAQIQPPDGGSVGTSSAITVAGALGPITDVNVQLRGLTHTRPIELYITLTGPNGQTVGVMADACGNSSYPVADLTLTFDDEAAGLLPLTSCVSGSFRPTNHPGSDQFDVPPTATALTAFDGADANGVWTLRVRDYGPAGHAGQVSRGFALDIETKDVTSPDTTVTKKPRDSRRSRAKIKFTATEVGSHFECKVGKRSFKPCSSPLKLKNLTVGKHKIKVRAVDAAGNVDATPAKVTWKVLARPEKP